MDITLRSAVLPHGAPDASPALHRDVLGFEAHDAVGSGAMRRPAAGPAGRPREVRDRASAGDRTRTGEPR
ncbi:hypothetical protein ACFSJS_17005 [Streptomyces desertarenae]|uniref:Uncharacterized protein n=1 Tax=Streptomyces desertarenae TaxID=2666184 RepID=A0ABW4PMB9_9ACTN